MGTPSPTQTTTSPASLHGIGTEFIPVSQVKAEARTYICRSVCKYFGLFHPVVKTFATRLAWKKIQSCYHKIFVILTCVGSLRACSRQAVKGFSSSVERLGGCSRCTPVAKQQQKFFERQAQLNTRTK